MIDPSFDATALLQRGIHLSHDVVIDFHEGATSHVWWATLHVGRQTIEVGTIRDAADLNAVLVIVGGILLERYGYADGVYCSEDGATRLVLIGRWILNARLVANPNHLCLASAAEARAEFRKRTEGPDA